jgi:RimJ/RimL family protein N-acetyltransferase
MNKDKLRFITSIEGLDYYKYIPTFGKWLYKNYEHMHFRRWIRFLLEFYGKGKYVVYYIAKDSAILGYCLVAPGGRRLKCSDQTDIVLGPYYILPGFRGRGYSKQLIRTVTEKLHGNYICAYDYIAKDNIPSLKATEACGFVKYGELKIVGLLRHLVATSDGDYVIFRKLLHNTNVRMSH